MLIEHDNTYETKTWSGPVPEGYHYTTVRHANAAKGYKINFSKVIARQSREGVA